MNTCHLRTIMYVVVIIIACSTVYLLVAINKAEASSGTNFIPSWIKKTAVWWHDGKISDSEFINNIKWFIGKKIIPIQLVITNNNTTQRPYEFKDIAYYWGTGKISDKDFVSTIKHLVKNGVIKMDDDFISNVNQKMKTFSVSNETEKSVVVIPVLTSSAYSDRGFYAHYRGECTRCLTIKIRDDTHSFVDSSNGLKVLQSLGYNTITDIDIDKNPKILEKYDEVILLHNEYVTQREFDAITKHSQVLYLYPNALYAKVRINYLNDTVTLVRGHGYPNNTIANGFSWKFDNSKLEYDRNCENWKLYKINNGVMLNCYPEERLNYDMELLQAIKDF